MIGAGTIPRRRWRVFHISEIINGKLRYGMPVTRLHHGQFAVARPIPNWFTELAQGKGLAEWEQTLRRAQFALVEEVGYAVRVYNREQIFYAEAWGDHGLLWYATFDWEDWPPFLTMFVRPQETIQKLSEIIKRLGEDARRPQHD
jgi:hypothetical protein